MSRTIHRLKAVAVAQMNKPGLYADGGGLYLQITPAGVRSWLFRHMRNGKARGMGLGPLHTITLSKARAKAHECREMLLAGADPLEVKKEAQHAQRLYDAKALSFRDCATSYHLAHKDGWKNKKHADQWTNTLSTYAYPVIGDLPIASVDVGLVMKIHVQSQLRDPELLGSSEQRRYLSLGYWPNVLRKRCVRFVASHLSDLMSWHPYHCRFSTKSYTQTVPSHILSELLASCPTNRRLHDLRHRCRCEGF